MERKVRGGAQDGRARVFAGHLLCKECRRCLPPARCPRVRAPLDAPRSALLGALVCVPRSVLKVPPAGYPHVRARR